MTTDVLSFLGGDPRRVALFEAVEALIAPLGPSDMAVTKSQISWGNPKKFAFLSLPRRKGLGWPQGSLVLTFGLGRPLDHPRIFQAVEPYPSRWTHHVLLTAPAEADPVIGGFLGEAYTFSLQKGRRRGP